MFETWQQKAALAVFIFLLLTIPIGSYLLSQRQTFRSRASEGPKIATGSATPLEEATASSLISPLDQIKQLTNALKEASASPTPVTAFSFGPTLGFKLSLEGRPEGKMTSKVFVGISEGKAQNPPKYLLSFTIDLPDTGIFTNLSLAGLNAGSNYTAYLKPTVQIATSSSFIMSPTVSYLNNNKPLNLLTGDLNQDNVINSADYSIEKALLGTNSNFKNWNPDADFNLDGVVNSIDLAYIIKNMAKTGDSGVWTSTPTKPSGTTSSSSGYWLWMP